MASTDGKGRTVDFTNTVIIATSNVGADLIQENLRQESQGGGLGYGELKGRVSERLRSHFRPEFLNRIDEIVLFHALDQEQIRQIVELTLTRLDGPLAAKASTCLGRVIARSTWRSGLPARVRSAGAPASRAQRSRVRARP